MTLDYTISPMLSRRHFLGTLASAPVLAQSGAPVIIAGAGLAGLCAAYELTRRGQRAIIFEAQSHPGGRVRTLRDHFASGLSVEAGAETIPSIHDLPQRYAREFDLMLRPVGLAGRRSFYHVRGRRISPGPAAEWPYDLTEAERALGIGGLFRKYIDAAANQAMEAGFSKRGAEVMLPWDGQTPGAWLRSAGASAGAAQLLSLGFGESFGSAASFLLHRVNVMGSTASYRIEGGNDRLPHEFAKRVDVRYGAAVANVSQNDSEVRVTVARGGATETHVASHFVCALPCPVLGRILDDARLSAVKRQAIREQHYSRTVKVFLQSRSRFWLKQGWSGLVTTDLPIERLTPDPGVFPDARGALAAYPIAAYASRLESMTESDRIAAALAQARQIFPEWSSEFEGGVSKAWGLDPWQQGAFALHTPGQIRFIDILAKPEGRIHFAGEHTSAWTGWQQGALQSALRVVEEISGRAQ